MTNFEYWKDRILEILESYILFGLKNGCPTACCRIECKNCDLYEDEIHYCNIKRIEWLYSEHEEKPKLTKRERMMCEVLGYGWIATDIDGTAYWYETLPNQYDTYYDCEGECTGLSQIGLSFSFIKFYTGPWKVADLLQLEVMEE